MNQPHRYKAARRGLALVLMLTHLGAMAATQACDPALDEAIEKRRQASDQQIDTVDQDISNSGKRMLDCLVDFADVVGNSITVGGQKIDLSGVVKSMNQEACRMTREAKQGRLPKFPSLESVGRGAAGQLPGRNPPYTPPQRPPTTPTPTFPIGGSNSGPIGSTTHQNIAPQSSGSMSIVYDALSNAMGGRR
ncbi:hypothetical protein [Achromobacter sp. DH1f]|uniref:hypothetical protein n=1 Tax=Achromobacter sp. DH1f TaxID=1397275 RepID=UPI000469E7EE|nr:hypothetical protein [Achromobacter sp. DH1f]